MTNEEAKAHIDMLIAHKDKALKTHPSHGSTYGGVSWGGTYKEISQPCEDCISREAVIDHICEDKECYKEECKGRTLKRCPDLQWVFDLPSVTPYPKVGHNENNDYADCDQFVCSECGIELQDWHRVERDIDDEDITYHEYTFKYCPNCGAEMSGGGEDEASD